MQLLLSLLLLKIFLSTSEAVFTCGYGHGGSKISTTVVVDKSGNGNFNAVQAAVDSVPVDNNKWFKIQINSGTYAEMVYIPPNKPCIFFQGQGRANTKITWNAHDETDTSATFTSYPDHLVVKGVTFENSYNLGPEGQARGMKQALSARIYGDKSAFYECGFLGVQDTLWDVKGVHYFSKCYIEGVMDFIFGGGQSLYEDCRLNATVGSFSSQVSEGAITAQGRSDPSDPGGFVFLRGTVASSGPVLLGRGYRQFSRVIFQDTYLDAVVLPQGWDAWFAKGNEGDLMYSEVNCQGRGSDKSKRVPWEKEIDESGLEMFSKSTFVDTDGWISQQP